jgi:hypothetical protein
MGTICTRDASLPPFDPQREGARAGWRGTLSMLMARHKSDLATTSPLSKEEKTFILTSFSSCAAIISEIRYRQISPTQIDELVDHMYKEEFGPNTIVFREGENCELY